MTTSSSVRVAQAANCRTFGTRPRRIDRIEEECSGIGGFLTPIGVAPETQAVVRRILLINGARPASAV